MFSIKKCIDRDRNRDSQKSRRRSRRGSRFERKSEDGKVQDRNKNCDDETDNDRNRDYEHHKRKRRSRDGSPRNRESLDRKVRERDRNEYHKARRRTRDGPSWERKSLDRKVGGRDRCCNGDRNSDSERSLNRVIIGASGSKIIGYKSQPPNNTIIIRGLAQHITENDIRQDIFQCDLMPKDIRLIRKKDTGVSRGFAFVEFTTLGEAVRWMDVKQGVLIVQDKFHAIMEYSIPKDVNVSDKSATHVLVDWFCIKCGAQNFKRIANCFKCHGSQMESEVGVSGSEEICSYATKTIMLRNLDVLTTADSVMAVLSNTIPDLVKSISAVRIGEEPLTSTSRGICYLGTESTTDSLIIYRALSRSKTPLQIDGKTVILSYCKYSIGDTKKVYSQIDNVSFSNASVPSTYAVTDVNSLAESAAGKYAKTVQEYLHYVEYYKAFFSQQIGTGNSITLHEGNQVDATNAAAAVAQSAIQQMNANKSFYYNAHLVVPTGTGGKKYPVPDVSKYVYDKTTGYQYDQTTGLYYDSNSNYYWNNAIKKYLYWDHEKSTYLLAPTYCENMNNQQQDLSKSTTQESKKSKLKKEKQDKVKVGKKIAKDMDRWAKAFNQKNEICNVKAMTDNSTTSNSSFTPFFKQKSVAEPLTSPLTPFIAVHEGQSESSEDEDKVCELLDYTKLICNLCKRQLGSVKALIKHAKLSTLHRQNLEARKKKKSNIEEKIFYHVSTKEGHMEYGNPEELQPSILKDKYLKLGEMGMPMATSSVSKPIRSENIGNKLLQKMGRAEGQGLGKQNQDRIDII